MANDNETHEEVCTEMRSFGSVPPPMFAWRDLADRAEAAHKREIEIASKYSAEHEARIFNAIRERDSLIKELADALYEEVSWIDDAVGIAFPITQNHEAKIRELVARARKMV